MTRSVEECQEAVRRGVAWLDEHAPYWWKVVELPTFDIRYGCRCVLGQVFVDDFTNDRLLNGDRYDDAYNYVCRVLFDPNELRDEDLGFDVSTWCSDTTTEYDRLQALWEVEIRARRARDGEI